jgi:hypothetical protein
LILSQREVCDFSGEMQNDLKEGAHLPTHPLKNPAVVAVIAKELILYE